MVYATHKIAFEGVAMPGLPTLQGFVSEHFRLIAPIPFFARDR